MIKICGTTPAESQGKALKLAEEAIRQGCTLVEFRLDYAQTQIDLRALASSIRLPKVATLRPAWEGGLYHGSEDRRTARLLEAAGAGFDYVDIEVKTPRAGDIADKIRGDGGKVIASFHDFNGTPDVNELGRIVKLEEEMGDIYKIVTTAKSYMDNLKILNLQSGMRDGVAICFAMGKLGLPSRVMSPLLGAPFTYASVSEGLEVTPGQISVKRLNQMYKLMELSL